MRINNNISALNTHSRLNAANNAKSGSLAKLSSGLRINRAGDDAAGLAISEKMRGQIGGLKQATRNAQDGISLIQTAEGALNETHSILQRMRELAVQSANDTNTETDREEIQKEVNELSEEITRISTDTEFNTQKLLNGEYQDKEFHIGANKNQSTTINILDMSARELKVAGETGATFDIVAEADTDAKKNDAVAAELNGKTYDVVKNGDAYELVNKDGDTVATSNDNGITYTTSGGNALTFKDAVKSGEVVVAGITGDKISAEASIDTKLKNGTYTVVASANHEFLSSGYGLLNESDELVAVSTDGTNWTNKDGDKVLEAKTEIQIGKIVVGSDGGIDVSSQTAANLAIETINEAIETVSAERSKLGAMQNRLDHTINNLSATAENLSEAESRIRDVDMAEEMMEFTKNNILSQAATSMLAQANQMPQSVLQLLQ